MEVNDNTKNWWMKADKKQVAVLRADVQVRSNN